MRQQLVALVFAMMTLAMAPRTGAQGHTPSASAKDTHTATDAHGPKETHGPKDPHAANDPHAAAEPKTKAPSPREAHGSHDASASPATTLKPAAHKLAAPATPRGTEVEAHAPAEHSAKAAASQANGGRPRGAGHEAEHGEAARPTREAPRPPNPALEAVLQRITRRISGAKAERPARSAAPHAAAAPSPSFRVQVTAPSSVAALTPRVRLTWRPTVVWPRAVLPAADADARVRMDWDSGH